MMNPPSTPNIPNISPKIKYARIAEITGSSVKRIPALVGVVSFWKRV